MNGRLHPITVLNGLGGALIALSAFFVLGYGPMGGEVSFHGLVYWNLLAPSATWLGWPVLLRVWPVAFGILELLFCLANLKDSARTANAKWHTIAIGVLLVLIAGGHLLLFGYYAKLGRDVFRRDNVVPIIAAAAVLIAVGTVFSMRWNAHERLPCLRIIASTWIMVGHLPISIAGGVLAWGDGAGIGLWILLTGTVFVMAASMTQLAYGKVYAKELIP